MRVIAGEARGVRLASVPRGVRPTADRVRESLFNALGQFFEGGDTLELYAGTGALGIEALSRGCERCVFVEKDDRSIGAIRENLRKTGLEGRAEVVREDVGRVIERFVAGGRRFDLIFADPPYRIAAAELQGVMEHFDALLAPDGRAVVERGDAPEEGAGVMKGVTRRYGGTFVTIFEQREITMKVAVCPGSFDPITTGHLDIIRRSAEIFDHVVIAVGANMRKSPMLPAEERARLIEKVTGEMENVSVEIMSGLLVEFAREQGAKVVVKGLRAVSDFESELEQAQLNRKMYPELDTVFIMAAPEHSFLSSSAIREITRFGGEVRGLVPDGILDTVRKIYSNNEGQ